ncbi:MAG: DnaB-like helicase C-terminal domain-containing protein [Gemmatimonadaceae bacterium]
MNGDGERPAGGDTPALQFPFRGRAGDRPANVRSSDALSRFESLTEGAARVETVPTGFPGLDALLGGGMRRGDLLVLGGDVSSGKSALALAIAIRAAMSGHAAAFLSGEMSPERIMERALALEGRASVDALRSGVLDDATHASVATASLKLRDRAPVLVRLPDTGVTGVSELTVEHLGLELVVVDALQTLATGAGTLDEELARAVRELKELAVRRNCALLLVSHLAGTPRNRTDARPTLEDFGALGAVRQQADVVMGLYREELYSTAPGIQGATEVHILKNRNGPSGYVDMYFYSKWLRFEDVMEPDR